MLLLRCWECASCDLSKITSDLSHIWLTVKNQFILLQLLTIVDPHRYCSRDGTVCLSVQLWNSSTSIGWIGVKFCTDIVCVHQRMNPIDVMGCVQGDMEKDQNAIQFSSSVQFSCRGFWLVISCGAGQRRITKVSYPLKYITICPTLRFMTKHLHK